MTTRVSTGSQAFVTSKPGSFSSSIPTRTTVRYLADRRSNVTMTGIGSACPSARRRVRSAKSSTEVTGVPLISSRTSPRSREGLAWPAGPPGRTEVTKTPSRFVRFSSFARRKEKFRAVRPHSLSSSCFGAISPRSTGVKETFIILPSRLMTAATGRPVSRLVVIDIKSGICSSNCTLTGLPPRLISRSPALSPALVAGESSQTPPTSKPVSPCHSLNSGCGAIPSQLRLILPFSINCCATALAKLPGMAPDNP